jgi:hypothetical protein
MSDFNSMLWRPLNSGMQFNSLFPASTCTKTDIGSGNTDFSIKEMNALVLKFAYQTELVAEILEKDTLQNTCNAIKDFAYNHFQYKADDEDQMLRSPACSWHDRAIGIDCKSYSILASCLLTNLGIKHYIRRIKQQGYAPEQFTHVYVVVPNNQKTADLQQGSICIDGTLKQSNEPSFLIKSDLYMDLQHFALNGLASTTEEQPKEGTDWGQIVDFVKNFKWSSIKGLFLCVGNSAYTHGAYIDNANKITAYFQNIIIAMNKALVDKNMNAFNESVADFFGETKLFQKTFEVKLSEGWPSNCTTKRFQQTIAICQFHRDNVGEALSIYLNQYFTNSGATRTDVYSSEGLETSLKIWGMYLGTSQTINQPVNNWQPKAVTIPAFAITPYVFSTSVGAPINPQDVLKELVIKAADYTPSKNNSNGSGLNDLPANTTQAGFGVVGWLLVGGAMIYGVKEFSKPTKK